jgi:hypothetical protein
MTLDIGYFFLKFPTEILVRICNRGGKESVLFLGRIFPNMRELFPNFRSTQENIYSIFGEMFT